MDRRAFIVGGVAAFAAPLAAEAQQAGKVYRVGLVAITPVAGIVSDPTHPFKQRLPPGAARSWLRGGAELYPGASVCGRED